MKTLYTLLILTFCAQYTHAQKIVFIYNEAGLRVKRGSEDALPVTLVEFTAEKAARDFGAAVLLRWQTSTEENSDRFEIERSADGSIWTQINTIPAKGGKNETSHYDATDVAPLEGQNYYRLKMIDRDDSFAYSRIRNVLLETPVVLFPNPAQNKLFVRGILCERVQVYDSSGQMLVDENKVTQEGIDISQLPDGPYIVKVIGASGKIIVRTIVKK